MIDDARRPTPYELIFGPAVFDASRFADVREQVGEPDAVSADELFMVPAAGVLLRELAPGGGVDVVAHVSALLFSAYRFWLHGRHVYRLDDAVFRGLLDAGAADGQTSPGETPTVSDAAIVPPGAAGYVQFPRRALWARVSENDAVEPVDGFFWSVSGGADGRIDILYVLGVRAGRPGVSLFNVELETVAQLAQWAGIHARSEGTDFSNILPGGELQGYRGMTTAAEALKLAALCITMLADRAGEWETMDEADQVLHTATGGEQ